MEYKRIFHDQVIVSGMFIQKLSCFSAQLSYECQRALIDVFSVIFMCCLFNELWIYNTITSVVMIAVKVLGEVWEVSF